MSVRRFYRIHKLLQPVVMWNSALEKRSQPLSWLVVWWTMKKDTPQQVCISY